MRIAVESNIPFIKGVFEAAGHEVSYLSPEDFTHERIKKADALVIRTRTVCNAALLDDTNVKKIATATIGIDHIDLAYCKANGIEVYNAPGCNAPAVAQYVMAAMATVGITAGTIGIVGVGNVGSIVDRWAKYNGFKTLLCDPPLGMPATIDEIAQKADIITFHTPLDESTHHMANADFFASLKRTPVIINAARGPIVETNALIAALETKKVSGAIIDCWEGEPEINGQLLEMATIATPHIAGYSLEGKRRATAMAVRAIDSTIDLPIDRVTEYASLKEICESYDPRKDSNALKEHVDMFEQLRNTYNYRPEP